MGTLDPEPPDSEATPTPDASLLPTLDVDIATVSVVDGIWHDQPDNVAAFVEARLGDLARGRGNLYICLDISGEVEGRSDVERALIEVIRDTYATSRGSISFALAEGLRAANTHLYEANRQVVRELRRMAGVSVVVLRGNDLYIAQSGPGVVYVEAGERLTRFPTESDWFVEDAPLIAPQGTASAPLGMRREFASDLAHVSVSASDVFVLATRALTQLASTEELAIAFTERSAQEIASHLEELGEDADITALVAELIDPRNTVVVDDSLDTDDDTDDSHIESLPLPLASLVSLDESEPPLEEDEAVEDEIPEPQIAGSTPRARTPFDTEQEIDWDAEDAEPEPAGAYPRAYNHADEYDAEDDELETDTPHIEPQPVYAAAAAALPIMQPPPYIPQATPPPSDADLERRRAERTARRAAQKEGMTRAAAGVTGGLFAAGSAVGGGISNTVGAVNWDGVGKRTNRSLNIVVGALIAFFLLLVRLVLPGATTGSTKIIPRRATSDAVWLKAFAIALPVLFIALAFGRFMLEVGNQNNRYDAMVAQADTIVKQAVINPDREQSRAQLNQALQVITDARQIRDTQKARAVLYSIQDQLNEIDGIAVLHFLPTLVQLSGSKLGQIVAGDQDIFVLDGSNRIYQFLVNDASGASKPVEGDGTLLKTGDKVGTETVDSLSLLTGVTRPQDKAALVAVAPKSLLVYDMESDKWSASPVEDSAQWGDIRSVTGFGGNVYLLDAKNHQIYKYTPTDTGFSAQGTPYFPADALPPLSRAVDLAIDGDVWVLSSDGAVQRFRAGAPVTFSLGVMPTPLKNPVAIFTRPEVDSLYIADAGNQRIVEFDKNGAFVRQFKPEAAKADVFQNLRDFTVNETKRKLYFVSGDAAYMANILK